MQATTKIRHQIWQPLRGGDFGMWWPGGPPTREAFEFPDNPRPITPPDNPAGYRISHSSPMTSPDTSLDKPRSPSTDKPRLPSTSHHRPYLSSRIRWMMRRITLRMNHMRTHRQRVTRPLRSTKPRSRKQPSSSREQRRSLLSPSWAEDPPADRNPCTGGCAALLAEIAYHVT